MDGSSSRSHDNANMNEQASILWKKLKCSRCMNTSSSINKRDYHQAPMALPANFPLIFTVDAPGTWNSLDINDNLHTELWRACAGPLVTIPCVGEKVFYFPQGHIEMLDAHIIRTGDGQIPSLNLPSKIPCRVVNVKLKARAGSDEVFAEVTLFPLSEEEENTSEKETIQPSAPKQSVVSFCKILASSETSIRGSFSIPKRHAQKCLPQLDMSMVYPAQELVAKDLHGEQWIFQHTYRGKPKRHYLSPGWSTFVKLKKPVAGDAFVLVRGNGEFRVHIRRAMKRQNIIIQSAVTAENMLFGVLSSVSVAITDRTTFIVHYQPRTSSSNYIVPYNRYMESTMINYSVGMRFSTRFEGEDGHAERQSCVISGIEDAEPITWPNSKWKCLKVQWVDIATSKLPERVSPWEIMPYCAAACVPSATSCSKTQHTPHFQFAGESSDSHKDGSVRLSAEPAAEHHQALQGQERIAHLPSVTDNNTNQIQEMESPGPETATSSINEPFVLFDKVIRTDYLTPMSCEPLGSGTVNAQMSLTRPVTAHSRTKVHKYGYALGRKIALSRFNCYEELLGELDRMFEFDGGLVDGSKGRKVIYTDAKEQPKMLGDCEWLDFLSMVQKMYIYPQELVEKLRTSLAEN